MKVMKQLAEIMADTALAIIVWQETREVSWFSTTLAVEVSIAMKWLQPL